MEPKVPISKPLPNKEAWIDGEKKDETRKINGITPPNKTNLSFGITNFPSPSLATNQKNKDKVAPTDKRKPLLASSVTGEKGIKKKKQAKIVNNNRTKTKIRLLNENEVIEEIARISSGEINEVSLKYATELRNKKASVSLRNLV